MSKITKKVNKADKSLELSRFFKTIGDENRMKIVLLLNNQEMNVTNIYQKLKLPQNLTSHHISKLKSLDLLAEKREGTFRNYSVNKKKLKEFVEMFRSAMKI